MRKRKAIFKKKYSLLIPSFLWATVSHYLTDPCKTAHINIQLAMDLDSPHPLDCKDELLIIHNP